MEHAKERVVCSKTLWGTINQSLRYDSRDTDLISFSPLLTAKFIWNFLFSSTFSFIFQPSFFHPQLKAPGCRLFIP